MKIIIYCGKKGKLFECEKIEGKYYVFNFGADDYEDLFVLEKEEFMKFLEKFRRRKRCVIEELP